MDKKILVFLSLILSGCGGEDGNNITNVSNETQDNSNVQEIVYLNSSDRASPERSTFLKREIYHAEIEGDKVDQKYLTEKNIIKIAKIIDDVNGSEFSKKNLGAIYSDFDSSGNEFFIINFLEGGYFLLNTSINDNVIHYANSSEVYTGLPICSDCSFTVSLDWMSIIATEVALPAIKLRKAARTASRELVTKITWDSGSSRSDFDLFIKSPDGEICNWKTSNKDKSKWGAKHLRDDQGGSYKRSYEAFSVDLDVMDSYASKNNLFSNDNGNYKFYIARYTGPDINYNFSYGLNGECSAYNSNDCSKGNWENNVSNTGISNASYAVKYTPQRVSTSSLSNDELLAKYSPLMAFAKSDKTPVPVDAFIKHSILYKTAAPRDNSNGVPNNIVNFGKSLPSNITAKKTTTFYYGAGSSTTNANYTFSPTQRMNENTTMSSGGSYFLDFRNGKNGGNDYSISYYDQFSKYFEFDKNISFDPNSITNSYGKSIYGRVVKQSDKIYLQYYFFYLMNDWNQNNYGVGGFHEGDWEGIVIELDNNQNPLRMGVSIHLTGETKSWSDVNKKSDHPVVYIGDGGHPTYFNKGTDGQFTNYLYVDYHNKDERILHYKGSTEKGSSINYSAIKTPYSIINIESDSSTKSWLTSNVYWGEDYLDSQAKSVASPGSSKSHDPDRWSDPKKWLDDRE